MRLDLRERRFLSELGFRVVAISCISSCTWAVRVGMAGRKNHYVNCRILLRGMGRAEAVVACTCTTALHNESIGNWPILAVCAIADH